MAVIASGATAWLTLRQATQQVQQSAVADQQEVEEITSRLREYVLAHGTWAGAEATVADLSRTTQQRIRLVSTTDRLVVDSDVLAGRPARRVVGAALGIDPAAALELPGSSSAAGEEETFKAVALITEAYRQGFEYAACLTRSGVRVQRKTDGSGAPVWRPATGETRACTQPSPGGPEYAALVAQLERECGKFAVRDQAPCLQGQFVRRLSGALPGAYMNLGGVAENSPTLAAGPVVALAGGVAALAMLVGLLLSRAVVRPVATLARAADEWGAGNLDCRVQVSGRDEIATLARSFNAMATSLQASEHRQQQLIADVAHELRTPLSNLRGYLEALKDGVIEPTPELAASLHEEVLLQQRIVEDLQLLSLAESGTLTYHLRDIDIDDLLRACRAAHGARAGQEGVDLRLEEPTGPPLVVHGDEDRLRQVLGNLLSNAVRAASSGSGSVVLGARRDDDQVRIDVRDTGGGIAAEDLVHIFDRFWRSDPARGRSTGGSGLGLSIVRQIVADHGGRVRAESVLGEGSTFSVYLPAAATPVVTGTGEPQEGSSSSTP